MESRNNLTVTVFSLCLRESHWGVLKIRGDICAFFGYCGDKVENNFVGDGLILS